MDLKQTYGGLNLPQDQKDNRGAESGPHHSHERETLLRSQFRSLNLKLDQMTSMVGELSQAMVEMEQKDSPEPDSKQTWASAPWEDEDKESVLIYRLCSLMDLLRETYGFGDAGVFLCDRRTGGIKNLAFSSQSSSDENLQEFQEQTRRMWESGDIHLAIREEKRHTVSVPEKGSFLIIPFKIMGTTDGFWVMNFRQNVFPENRSTADMVVWTEIIRSCIESLYVENITASPQGYKFGLLEKEKVYATTQLGRALTHEINNPLQVILGRTQLLRMNHKKSPSSSNQKILEALENSATKISSLVKDFSDHLHRQSTEIGDREEVNVLHILNSDLALLAYLLNSRKVKLETDFEDKLPPVLGNPGDLEMAVLILIWELEGWLASGGTVRLRVRAEGEHVWLDLQGRATEKQVEPPDPDRLISGERVKTASGILERLGGRLEPNSGRGDEFGFRVKLVAASAIPRKPQPSPELIV